MPTGALRQWAQQTGVAIDDEGWSRLEALVAAWGRYGKAFNLVGDLRREALVEHVREGLMAVGAVEGLAPASVWQVWVDVGSGAGIPGLVVGAVRAVPLRLVEPRERRAAFLDMMIHQLSRGGGEVVRAHASASTWNETVRGGIVLGSESATRVISSKAVFAPSDWLDMALPRCSTREIVVAHVGSEVAEVAGRRSDSSRRHAGRGVAAFWGRSD